VNPENRERRIHERRDFANRIVYVSPANADHGLVKGVTMNMSKTGLCFATFTPVKKNDTIWILKSMLPIYCQKGTVRWIRKMQSHVYKVGLKFQGDAAKP
jgi:hypothetical protein